MDGGFIPGEWALYTHWIGHWEGPRDDLDAAEKILDSFGARKSDPSVVQPLASRYSDYAIPAPILTINFNYY
jgi:hypothetical protein